MQFGQEYQSERSEGSYNLWARALRSSTYPEGFPNLKGTNLKRVTAANKLYAFLTKVVLRAHDRNIIFVIENPRSSLFWLTTFFQKVKHLFTFVAHQACAYGSSRPKWTALAVNRPDFWF